MKTSSRFQRGVIFVFTALFAAVAARAGTLYWKGPGNASAAANWYADETLETAAGVLPQTDDGIVFVAASRDMTWDVNDVALASWTQQAGYAGTVTFKTGKQNGTTTAINGWTDDNGETRILKITGDCVLLGGTWTHTGQPSIDSKTAAWTTGEGVYQLIADVGGNMTLGDGAVITTTGRGFAKGQGPGTIGGGQGGASHGGNGGYKSDASIVKPCYGVYSRPITQGSGGCSSYDGTIGGGVVRLTVGGKLTLSSTSVIRSDGKESTYYPAAGGTVSLIAGEIAGGGTISANGANNTNKGYGGAGGGGRVACVLTRQGAVFPDGFKDIPTAWSVRVNGGGDGYGGTVYFETAADGEGGGEVIVDGFNNTGGGAVRNASLGATLGGDGGLVHLKKLTVRNGGALLVPAGEKLLSDGYVEQTVSQLPVSVRLKGGELVLKSNQLDYASPSLLCSVAAGSVLWAGEDGTGTLNVLDGASMFVTGEMTLKGSLHVAGGGKVAQPLEGGGYRMNLTVTGDVTVDATGEITALGKGYAKNAGPGGSKSGNVSGVHGGQIYNPVSGQHCYGSITRPITCGSGSGAAGNGYGGGAVALTVLGNLVNNGTVTADGGLADYYSGAGGSVWVMAETLSGAGVFSANGGVSKSGGPQAYPGSGGRVAVWLTGEDADFGGFANAGGRFEAFGGTVKGSTTQGSGGGGAGTVYLQTGAQQEHEGTLIIDNGGANTCVTEISAGGIGEQDVTDTEVGDVIIRNGGKVKVDTATLTVHGDLLTGTTLTEVNGGLVFVDADRVSHITGKNTCSHFRCETPGKQLVFGTGADELLSVSDGGSFTVVGDGDAAIVMRGDDAGAYWKLAVSLLAETSVEFVDPAKSDASGGQKIVASNSDAGKTQDNLNWGFVTIVPDAEITWTGAANGNWADSGNWDLERAPVETDKVIIPALTGDDVRYPRMNGFAAHVKTLTIAAGASLNLDGGDLTVDGATVVAGTLTAVGGERIELRGDVTFAQGAFAPARSTVCLAGDAAQTVGFAGARFFELTAAKGGGSVNFTGGFSVDDQLTLRATGAWTAQFGSADEFACTRLVADGAVGGASALTLTGAAVWTLNVRTYADVRGVAVTNSKATGITIYPQAPATDGGGNDNWRFGMEIKTWTGGSGDFSDPTHWPNGAVPGEGDLVRIDAAATVTVKEPAKVGGLTVSGASAKLLVRSELEVVEDVSVIEGGTVTVDSPMTVGGGVTLLTGGTLTHSANTTAENYRIDLAVGGNVFVDAESAITADAKGYGQSQGPGASGGNVSGMHAGRVALAYGTSHCYGSITRPTTSGSGSGWATGSPNGGGVIRLTVAGDLVNEGQISANAGKTEYYSGSGGSVWVTAKTVSGTGTFTANGGVVEKTAQNGGPGSGGRIALWLTDPAADFSALEPSQVVAYGGRNGGGGAGTVYLQTGAQQEHEGTLVIDNGGMTTYDTEIAAPGLDGKNGVTDTEVGEIVIRNGGKLLVRQATLTVHGDISNAGTFKDQDGEVVLTDASRTSKLTGANVFNRLTCQTPDKRIVFGTAAADSTAVNGALTLVGDAHHPIVLRGDVDDAMWKLNLAIAVVEKVKYVDPANSDARGGKSVSAEYSEVGEGQNNQNWSFSKPVDPGDPVVWTGASDDTWTKVENWIDKYGENRAPVPGDTVIITNGCPNYPTLPFDSVLNNLKVHSGATLTISGGHISVTNDLAVAGTLVFAGNTTLDLSASTVNFAGATVVPAESVVRILPGVETFEPGDCTFYRVEIPMAGNSLVVTGGLKARKLDVRATAPSEIVFAAGRTIEAASVVFDGGDLSDRTVKNLTLRSSEPSSPWFVKIPTMSVAKGVRVSDSTASLAKLRAMFSEDCGRTSGWVFEDDCKAWTGGSGNFSDVDHWAGGEVPGAADLVLIDAAVTVTVDQEAAVGRVIVGGGETKAKLVVRAPLQVVDLLEVDRNGTVFVDVPATVRGSVTVGEGGTLTHTAWTESAPYKMDLTVGGNMTVSIGGTVDVSACGYSNDKGPGSNAVSGRPSVSSAASYGGLGRARGAGSPPSYGSVFEPFDFGSGGLMDPATKRGGGVAKITVAGELIVDGEIASDAFHGVNYYSGSGGSIWLTCGRLSGAGAIHAHGGNVTNTSDPWTGGGGRVAVYQRQARDWTAFTGPITAYGGIPPNSTRPSAGAGTVYLECAADGRRGGLIVIDDGKCTSEYPTPIPAEISPLKPDNLKMARVILKDSSEAQLMASFRIHDMEMEAKSKLYLRGNTLEIRSREHYNRAGWLGAIDEGGGAIVWLKPGFMLFLR